MNRCLIGALFVVVGLSQVRPSLPAADTAAALEVGFGEADVTPELKNDRPVYMAGFGHNRKATRVHDALTVRAVVLRDGEHKIALASVDVIGLFHATAKRVRAALPGFTYVLVSSTHNHEGPDTLGLWGPTMFSSGIDAAYLKSVEQRIVEAVRQADGAARPMTARIGMAKAPELMHDNREPYVKHDELVALQFLDAKTGGHAGTVVQWNCHPETLDSRNTEISADFVGYTVREVQEKLGGPVVYLTGTVGGLMTSLKVPIKDEQGADLDDGTFAKTERYGRLVGRLAAAALANGKLVRLTPLQARSREVYLPMDNKVYQLGRQLGVLDREAFVWDGDPRQAAPAGPKDGKKRLALRTEVAWLRLGELDVACVPGEIYPELVLDKVQDPPDAGADFPDAPIEPAVYKQLAGPYRMLIGLANDEIGYIIPKRQWDERPPFCYGRKEAQYGEVNSVGPDTAPLLCAAFRGLVHPSK